MTRYTCICCNYSTSRHNDYKKHLTTKKHKFTISNNIHIHATQPTQTNSNKIKQTRTNINQLKTDNYNKLSYNINDTIEDKIYNMENILRKGYTSEVYTCTFCLQNYKFKHTLRNHLKKLCNLVPNNYKAKLLLKHNSNNNTKSKLDIILFSNTGKLITTNNKTIVNNNTNNIINNITQLNPVGKESIEHISFDRMVEIMCSGNRMIKEYCKEVYKIEENKNAYVDTRKKIIYFINDKNEVEIEHLNEMLSKMVDTNVRKINKYYKDNADNFTPRTKNLFEETYGNYFCIINLNNIDDSDYIENEHSIIKKDFNDDMWLSLYNIKESSRKHLELEH